MKSKYEIYEEVKRELQLIDLNQHIIDMYSYDADDELKFKLISLTDEDKKKLIEKFNERYDCNVSENDQWQILIKEYIKEASV